MYILLSFLYAYCASAWPCGTLHPSSYLDPQVPQHSIALMKQNQALQNKYQSRIWWRDPLKFISIWLYLVLPHLPVCLNNFASTRMSSKLCTTWHKKALRSTLKILYIGTNCKLLMQAPSVTRQDNSFSLKSTHTTSFYGKARTRHFTWQSDENRVFRCLYRMGGSGDFNEHLLFASFKWSALFSVSSPVC